MKIYAATGHRPDKIGGYSKDALRVQIKVAKRYLKKKEPDKIISGLALGWDTAWAIAGIQLEIPVIAAVPFKGQEKSWPEESQERYRRILKACDEVKYVCSPGY
ncbi:MAG: SLOG family protein, partial [Pseudomonadales bacterium]